MAPTEKGVASGGESAKFSCFHPNQMFDFFQIPREARWASYLLVGFVLFVCWDQMHFWDTREDYSFGYLVPFFVGYVLYDRWPRIRAILLGEERDSVLAAGLARPWTETFLVGVSGVILVGCLAGLLLGALIRVVQGPDQTGTQLLALSLAIMILATVFFFGGDNARGEALRLRARVQLTGLFLFPALIWLVSAPMLPVLDAKIKVMLLGKVTAIVFGIFDFLGMPLEREGNVLILPKGQVGVAEACSGIRSLTACIFAGSFLASVFLDRLWKKVAMVVTAMVMAFFWNIVRSLFLTGWAYSYGSEALDDEYFGITVHDLTGYAVLGITCVCLLLLLPIFNYQVAPPDEQEANGQESDDAVSDKG